MRYETFVERDSDSARDSSNTGKYTLPVPVRCKLLSSAATVTEMAAAEADINSLRTLYADATARPWARSCDEPATKVSKRTHCKLTSRARAGTANTQP